jgi:MFS family permease
VINRTFAFAGISGALLAFFIAAGVPTPIFPLYEREWDFSPALLTVAFGVYAVALIVSLLVVGSLSDHVGRRPLLLGALAVELVAMVVFLAAPLVGWLIVGRVLQGLATGVASSAFGAAIVELAPEARKKLGAAMSPLATTAGLGLGALFAGVVALLIPDAAATTVWVILIAVMVLGTVVAWLTPETAPRRPGALASLRPHVAVPQRVRRLYAATLPALVAVFLTNALFLGLAPTILATEFGVVDPIVSGALNFAVFAVAAPASVATAAVRPHLLRLLGSVALAVAAILLLAALALAALPLLWVAAVIGGAGSGATLSAITRGLVPQVEVHERAGLFAAIFTVAYLTLGVAIIGAGLVATAIGVEAMATGYALVAAVVAIAAVVVTAAARLPRSAAAPAETPALASVD